MQVVQHKLSTAYHPQTDGQSEVLNRCVEGYLRCMCHATPLDWAKWLPLAEFWYNSNFHTATKQTPFEVVYGMPPPIHRPYLLGSTAVETVHRSLQQRDQAITMLKQNLCKAQNKMKQIADKRRSERTFEAGDWVYLKLHPYRQSSVSLRPYPKLAAKYYGPYLVTKKVGAVAYTLQLPSHFRIHHTFHVSLLKKHHGVTPGSIDYTLPKSYDSYSESIKVPQLVLEIRSIKKNNVAVVQWLIQWLHLPHEEATWETASKIMQNFPNVDPWGQGSFNGGGIDTISAEVDKGFDNMTGQGDMAEGDK